MSVHTGCLGLICMCTTDCIIAGDSLYNLWPETNWTTVIHSISSSCAYSSWCRVISLLLVKVCLKHDEHVVTVSTLESLCKSLSSVAQTAKLRYITSVQNSVFLEEYSKQVLSFTCQCKNAFKINVILPPGSRFLLLCFTWNGQTDGFRSLFLSLCILPALRLRL